MWLGKFQTVIPGCPPSQPHTFFDQLLFDETFASTSGLTIISQFFSQANNIFKSVETLIAMTAVGEAVWFSFLPPENKHIYPLFQTQAHSFAQFNNNSVCFFIGPNGRKMRTVSNRLFGHNTNLGNRLFGYRNLSNQLFGHRPNLCIKRNSMYFLNTFEKLSRRS